MQRVQPRYTAQLLGHVRMRGPDAWRPVQGSPRRDVLIG